MLRNTFGFGVTNIPVYVNGQFVYTPAVNRILQLAANVCDASTNSFYPDVFRPIFEHDNVGNVYIAGYTNVSSAAGPNTVTGTNDLQFLAPLDVEALTEMGPNFTPITENNNLVNIYEVPWIIGVKKYLPGFNQFSLLNTVVVDRNLQVFRNTVGGPIYTNHMYSLSISNQLSASFWNSYSNDYSSSGSGISVIFVDYLQMTLTNSDHPGDSLTQVFNNVLSYNTSFWPGSHWPHKIGEIPANSSFIYASWTNTFFSNVIYKTGAKVFVQPTDPDLFESNNTSCDPLPQFGLITTNWLRAIILDNGHVVDYVQLRGPIDATNFTTVIADPPDTNAQAYLWSTNGYAGAGEPSWGYVNQIDISSGSVAPPIGGSFWNPINYPAGLNSVVAGTLYFNAFFTSAHAFYYDGVIYENTNLEVRADYTAARTIFVPYLYQVNDPVVHYLASDLDGGPGAVWANGESVANGIWLQNNSASGAALLVPSRPYGQDIVRGRYQPWGQQQINAYPPSGTNAVLPNSFTLDLKDPLLWDPDYWNFPTNLLSNLSCLGQVHRGTPWQTIYLKSDDVLNDLDAGGDINSGTNTWVAWTRDLNIPDAAIMAPVNDWHLASLIIALLNTNNIAQLMSANDPNTADWLNVLNGITVYSNLTILPPFTLKTGTPVPATSFETYLMGANSAQAAIVDNAIALAKGAQPNQYFANIGDILTAPQLTVDSPWLSTSNVEQLDCAITDVAYEAIPAQLLPLLSPDSIGAIYVTNGSVNLQFSGSDAFSYELQQSTDLVNWTSISTNFPVQGTFNVTAPPAPDVQHHFYRTLLLR